MSRWALPTPGEDDEVADFAASFLKAPVTEDGAGAKDRGEARSDDGEDTKPYIDTVFYNDHNHPYAYTQQIHV
jgi:hypothetical protein